MLEYASEDVAVAEALVAGARERRMVRDLAHAVERLLPVKSGNWLEDGEEPLTAADFVGRMSLTDIAIYEGGDLRILVQ